MASLIALTDTCKLTIDDSYVVISLFLRLTSYVQVRERLALNNVSSFSTSKTNSYPITK